MVTILVDVDFLRDYFSVYRVTIVCVLQELIFAIRTVPRLPCEQWFLQAGR